MRRAAELSNSVFIKAQRPPKARMIARGVWGVLLDWLPGESPRSTERGVLGECPEFLQSPPSWYLARLKLQGQAVSQATESCPHPP